ncbi:YniB family protein [Yersinia ruckeri]|uniref:Membrane protein n=1 Tax=Yersinia ruckeri TaxID=29486 RepID=A0A085U824_YERRU|nr:YniB family protein [Yersinia ruckeri]AKA37397.1 membrane protein [Yersinia ruckeri]ARZ00856.1 yfeABCD locus regulator [Yersinia ruckeri]AUQ42949.1 hypothetical protein NJ56_14175 [Yersinia ruckeri]EEQ00608.1 hypothetical protein yruck0001_14350 [Yersinia ruckeri ATCC 29473]EKN3346463.1 YniB family protein [Yersinia ruckeri]
MTYQQAGRVAVIKRIAGWLVFIPALLSTLISVINFVYHYSEKTAGVNAVILDFVHVMTDMIRFNTGFLNIFWNHSPQPNLDNGLSGANILFFVIYMLIFVGLSLQASGARMSRQVKYIREGIEDQLILEQAKGNEGRTKRQLEEKIVVPRHTIFLQFFTLYILPIIIAIVAYFVIRLLGLMAID